MSDLYAELTTSPRQSHQVLIAAVLTWVVATGTAVVTALLMVMTGLFLGPVLDAFDSGSGNPRLIAYGIGAAVLLLCALADLVAWWVYRGHRWARWLLITLSLVAAAGGVALGYLVRPWASR